MCAWLRTNFSGNGSVVNTIPAAPPLPGAVRWRKKSLYSAEHLLDSRVISSQQTLGPRRKMQVAARRARWLMLPSVGGVAPHFPKFLSASHICRIAAGRRFVFHNISVDPPGDLPVFDGKMVLAGSLRVRLDEVLHEHGVCVLDSVFPREWIAARRAATARAFAECLGLAAGHKDGLSVGMHNGFAEAVQRAKGRYDILYGVNGKSDFMEVDRVLSQVLLQILTCKRVMLFNGLLHADPGCNEQLWHADGEHLFPGSRHVNLPLHCLNVFVPLVDITEDNGGTEFCLGSHRLTGGSPDIVWQDAQHKDRIGCTATPVAFTCRAGSVIMFDYRVLHRGLANNGPQARQVLYFTYAHAWFRDMHNFPVRSLLDAAPPAAAKRSSISPEPRAIAHRPPPPNMAAGTSSPRAAGSCTAAREALTRGVAGQTSVWCRHRGRQTLVAGAREIPSASSRARARQGLRNAGSSCIAGLATASCRSLMPLRPKELKELKEGAARSHVRTLASSCTHTGLHEMPREAGAGKAGLSAEDVGVLRAEFPGVSRLATAGVVLCDGAGGSQVHSSVAAAMQEQLATRNFNVGAPFPGSEANLVAWTHARETLAAFLNCRAQELVFGPSATALTFHMARSLARGHGAWRIGAGDNLVVTELDHACNVGPWEMLARETGAAIRRVRMQASSWTFCQDSVRANIDEHTKLVAVGAASNLIGSVHDLRGVVSHARAVGALSVVDAVHLAPHALLDVEAMGCDLLVCSPYKFFGPHLGVLFVRSTLAEALEPCRVRPASDELPTYEGCQGSRWELGTQNYEGIAGAAAAVDYIASLAQRFGGALNHRPGLGAEAAGVGVRDTGSDSAGDSAGGTNPQHQARVKRRQVRHQLSRSWELVQGHEAALSARFLEGVSAMPHIRLLGKRRVVPAEVPGNAAGNLSPTATTQTRALPRAEDAGSRYWALLPTRTPTFAIRVRASSGLSDLVPAAVADWLQRERGVWCASGNFYALDLSESLNVEASGGVVRLGFLHYNTLQEVDRVLQALEDVSNARLPSSMPE